MKEYPISYWYGPPVAYTSRAIYRQAREAGFTLAGPMGSDGATCKENIAFLDACAQNGMQAIVFDARMQACIDGADGWEQVAEAIVASYKNHPALYAYYVIDEPTAAQFPALARVVAKLRELDEAHPGYINLFPNYATPAMLGRPDYRSYVQDYIETVKPAFVSYDHYHFLKYTDAAIQAALDKGIQPNVDLREELIRQAAVTKENRSGFFDNIEVVRDLCLQYDLPFMVIVLLVEHGPYRNLTEAEIRFEVFQSLAYGAAFLSYFTYWTVPCEPDSWWDFKNGLIRADGCVLDHYYDVRSVNHDLLQYGQILRDKRSLCVMHYGEETEHVLHFTPDAQIRAVTSEGRLTLGEFAGGLVAICNKDFQSPCACTVTLGGPVSRFCTECGRWIETGADTVTLEIAAGDMVLLGSETAGTAGK